MIGGLGSLKAMIANNPDRYDHLLEPTFRLNKAGKKLSYRRYAARRDVWVSYWDSVGRNPAGERRNGPLNVGFGNSTGQIGPEYGFGQVVGNAIADPVLIIKTAWGGKSLAGEFRPPSSGGAVGKYYSLMVEKVHEVLNNLKKYYPEYKGQGYETVGFGWHQGWNDRIDAKRTAEYEANLVNLIKDVRAEFKTPKLPFVVATTGMARAVTEPTAMKLIAAQTAVSDSNRYPGFAGNVATVDTRPFDYGENSPAPAGPYHWNSNGESYFHIGEEMGRAMMKLIASTALANDQRQRIDQYLEESSWASAVQVAQYDRGTSQSERESLRRNPPHILLTNYMMLEYLLVRPADRDDIFANHRCRFLVLDEVHTYRGTLGSNIALLVRRLRSHLSSARQDWNTQVSDEDKPTRYPDLIPVGTSATIKSVDGAADPDHPTMTLGAFISPEELAAELPNWAPPLAVTHTALPAGSAFEADTYRLTWSPGFDQAGIHDITFTATDDGDDTGVATTATLTLRIEVRDANAPPAVDEIVNQTVDAGAALDIAVTAHDADDPTGSTLVLTAIGLPDFATMTDHGDGTATIHAAPTLADRGNYVVTVVATDDGNGDAEAVLAGAYQFVLSVLADNAPPVMAPVGDKVAVFDGELVFLVDVSDMDEDPLTFWSVDLPAAATFTPTGVYGFAEFRWTPTAADAGTYTVTLGVDDSGNGTPGDVLSDSETIDIVVRAANAAPILLPVGPQTVAEGQTLTINLSAVEDDGDPLTFLAPVGLPWGAELDSAADILTWTPGFADAGTYEVRLDATDGNLTSGEDVTITVTNVNQPPLFVPLPDMLAMEGLTTAFTVAAGDIDDDLLSYHVAQPLPPGATFDPDSQLVIWTPSFDQAGLHTIHLGVTDSGGLTDTLDVRVQVLNVNRAPTLDSMSGHVVLVGQPLAMTVPGGDPDAGATLTYTATGLPAGATLDPATGELTWTPNGAQAGEHDILIVVSDGELAASGNLLLVASHEPIPPQVLIALTPSFPVAAGQSVLVHVAASGVADVATIELTIGGQAMVLDEFGRARYTPAAPGHVEIVAIVTDVDGVVATATGDLKVRDLTDLAAPTVEIALPPAAAVIQADTDVLASVGDTNLDGYVLEIAPLGTEDFTVLAAGTAAVADAVLATVAVSRWMNGAYELRLTATDITGRATSVSRLVEIYTDARPTTYSTSVADLTVDLDGVAVAITRIFDSTAAGVDGLFGYGWHLAGAEPNITTNLPSTGGALREDTRIYANLPDGRRAAFTFDPVREEHGGLIYYRPAWTPDPGVDYQLETAFAAMQLVDGAFYQLGTGLPYHPATGDFRGDAYTLIAPDTRTYHYGADQRLGQVTTAAGVALIWSDSGVIGPAGRRISFQWDRHGRLSAVTSPDGGRILYTYDALGDLTAVNNLAGGQRSWYGYAADPAHYLTARADGADSVMEYSPQGELLAEYPIDVVLPAMRDLLGQSIADALPAGQTRRYAFILGERELSASTTGRVTLGIEVRSTGALDPAAAAIRGLPAGYTVVEPDRSLTLITLDTPGVYVIAISGADAVTAGGFDLEVYLAADVNLDAAVDGQDEAQLLAALGSAVGDAEYRLAADVNRDGQVAPDDAALQEGSFGFLANRPPVVTGAAPTALRGIAVSIDLSALSDDPEGDALSFVVTDVAHGTVTLADEGRTAVFTADAGYAGAAGFLFQADDGLARSAAAAVAIDVVDAALENIIITNRDMVLLAGQTAQLDLIGQYAGGVEITPGDVAYSSTDPGVVLVFDTGQILAIADGTATVVITAGGLTFATPITVGQVDDRMTQFYPSSYALQPGQTRQFVVRHRDGDSIFDISAAADASEYYVSDASVASMTAGGLLTAAAVGSTYVTVVNGGQSAVAAILVETPQVGQVDVDAGGGLVSDGAGITIGIGQGALTDVTSVEVTLLVEADLPYAGPTGFQFGGGFTVEMGDADLNEPLSVAMPAPAGLGPGDVAYLFQPVDVIVGIGEDPVSSWMIVDQMVVGADGMARTASPPFGGFRNNYTGNSRSFFKMRPEAMMFWMSPSLATAMRCMGSIQGSAYGPRTQDISVAFGQSQGGGSDYYAAPDLFGDWLLPAVADVSYTLNVRATAANGFVSVATTEVTMLGPGKIKEILVPMPPRLITREMNPPSLSLSEFNFGDDPANPEPRLVITGENFTADNPYANASDLGSSVADLFVTFEVGGRDTFNAAGGVQYVGGPDIRVEGSELTLVNNTELTVPVPRGVFVAGAYVTVTRPMELPLDGEFKEQLFTSNPIKLVPLSRYAFAALGGDDAVSVIDVTNIIEVPDPTGGTEPIEKLHPQEIAQIPLGVQAGYGTLAPRSVATTPDGTRAYVTLEGAGGIAVIDAMALHEVDMVPDDAADPDTLGVQHIELPNGAVPFDLAADSEGNYLYVSDSVSGTVYVIDINPFSGRYNELVRTVAVQPAPLGLRGLAVSPDQRRLYVTAPGRTIRGAYAAEYGHILIVNIDPDVAGTPMFDSTDNDAKIRVGPDPYDMTATDDPDVMLFVDRLDDSRGFGVLRRQKVAGGSGCDYYNEVDYVDLRPFGMLKRHSQGRGYQVFGVTNAQGIAYLPADTFGEHPAYAFITGYNRFVADDLKHDPNIGPWFAYNLFYKPDGENIARVPLAAGGNVGVIRGALGDFDKELERPRIVAATRPIMNSFPDNLVLTPGGFEILAAYQAQNQVYAFSTQMMVAQIEAAATSEEVYESFNQFEPYGSEPAPAELSVLLNGPLSTLPIDDINPYIDIRGYVTFYTGADDRLAFGVPPLGPWGPQPDYHRPIDTGRLPRGLASQPLLQGDINLMSYSPYNRRRSCRASRTGPWVSAPGSGPTPRSTPARSTRSTAW